MASFTKKVQNTPKVKSIRAKIRRHKQIAKGLSRQYKNAIKTESRRLSKKRK
jgi:hypothetical protein